MLNSKIGICNLALATIGEDAIRDFNEGNKRARMCDVFYDTTRDYLLSQFNWPFARRQAKLNKLAASPDWIPEGMFVYALPADCHRPITIWPEGNRQDFEVRGTSLYCKFDGDLVDVILVYTHYETDPTKFSAQFSNLLSLAIATRICPPLTQDKELTKSIFQQYEIEKREAWSSDAMIGSKQPHNNEDAAMDPFVDADFARGWGSF